MTFLRDDALVTTLLCVSILQSLVGPTVRPVIKVSFFFFVSSAELRPGRHTLGVNVLLWDSWNVIFFFFKGGEGGRVAWEKCHGSGEKKASVGRSGRMKFPLAVLLCLFVDLSVLLIFFIVIPGAQLSSMPSAVQLPSYLCVVT